MVFGTIWQASTNTGQYRVCLATRIPEGPYETLHRQAFR
jgi:hypothetical protein